MCSLSLELSTELLDICLGFFFFLEIDHELIKEVMKIH